MKDQNDSHSPKAKMFDKRITEATKAEGELPKAIPQILRSQPTTATYKSERRRRNGNDLHISEQVQKPMRIKGFEI